MLKPLTPGYLPLGQYDLLDAHPVALKGGEVGVFTSAETGDYYAADAGGDSIAQDVKVTTGSVTHPALYGLIDEGTSGYGTSFGTVIGGTVGQGTGFASGVASTGASGIVVVGPPTHFGSGKVTLWTMPGLYGISADAFGTAPTTVNQALYGTALTGVLTTAPGSSGANGNKVALFVNTIVDASLVSTSAAAATGSASVAELYAVYLLGPQV